MNANPLAFTPASPGEIEAVMSTWLSDPARAADSDRILTTYGVTTGPVKRSVVDPATPGVEISRTWYGIVVSVPSTVMTTVNKVIAGSAGVSGAASALQAAMKFAGSVLATGPAGLTLAAITTALCGYIAVQRGAIALMDQGYGMKFVWPWAAILAYGVPVLAAAAWIPAPILPADMVHTPKPTGAARTAAFIDYIGHDGQLHRAAIAAPCWVTDVEKKTLSGTLPYKSWDGSNWYVVIESVWNEVGQWRFKHSRTPDFATSHLSFEVGYQNPTPPGTWTMTLA